MLTLIHAPKKIRCSSGYPHWDFDHPLIAFPPLPRETKQRIFHNHAAALYLLGSPTAA
jgi:predicted TIM-barrel fold metal-dependent hydrolase